MKYFRVAIFLVWSIISLACNKQADTQNSSIPSWEKAEIDKINTRLRRFWGRDFPMAKEEIISPMLVLSTPFDCSSCTLHAKEILDSLEGLGYGLSIQGFYASDTLPASHFLYGRKTTSLDTKDSIRRRLNFLPTPMFFLLDSIGRIKALYPPQSFEDKALRDPFMEILERDLLQKKN